MPLKSLGALLLVVALLTTSHSYAISIDAIPALVKGNNEEVLAAEKDSQAASEGVSAAWARHYPSLSVKTTYLHLGDNIQLKLPTQNFTVGAATLSLTLPPLEIQKQDVFFSHALLTLPIFAGGRISAGVNASKAQRDEAKAVYSKTNEDKVQEALHRYFSVQLAREAMGILARMKANLDRIQAISESLIRSGLGSKFSSLQIKVAQADLGSRISEAAGKAQLADLAFKNSVGKSSVEVIAYDTPLKKISSPAKIDLFKVQALQKRKEFAILQSKQEQVSALKAFHTGEMLPTLYAVGTRNLISKNLPILQPEWAVGVVLEIPLTSWLGQIPEREKAARLQEKVEILRSRAKQEIPLQIEKIFTEMQTAEGTYKANEEGIEMAHEALRLAEVRFKNGDGSALEVLRSSTDLEKMEIQRAQRAEEFNRKLIELYNASGDTNQFIPTYLTSLGLVKEAK